MGKITTAVPSAAPLLCLLLPGLLQGKRTNPHSSTITTTPQLYQALGWCCICECSVKCHRERRIHPLVVPVVMRLLQQLSCHLLLLLFLVIVPTLPSPAPQFVQPGSRDKSGSCPVISLNIIPKCIITEHAVECPSDLRCPGPMKCCDYGCGKQCTMPVLR